jgi:cell division protein FtsB
MAFAMPRARLITLGLAALLLLVHAGLWFGKGSVPHVWGLRAQLKEQAEANGAARQRNLRIAAEVGDLKEGLEMIEEKARAELGMVRPDEVFVQITGRR